MSRLWIFILSILTIILTIIMILPQLRYVEEGGCRREDYFCFTVDVQTAGVSHVTSDVTVTWWGVVVAAILFDGFSCF